MAEQLQTTKDPDIAKESKTEPYVITYEQLQESHKDKAADLYHDIAIAAGIGDVGAEFVGGRQPLVIYGLYENAKDEANKEKAEDAKQRINAVKELLKRK